MIFRNKARDRVHTLLREYTELIGDTVKEFANMLNDYLSADKQFKEETRHLHDMEGQADRVRRTIEHELYAGAMLPAYRQDWIVLVEILDRVANKAEEAGDMIYLIRPEVPEALHEDLRRVAALTTAAFEPVPGLIEKLLHDNFDVADEVRNIEIQEGKIDKLQFHLTRRVYKEHDELEKVDKLVLKQVIDKLASVSDRIENVGDRIAIIATKRQF